VSAALLLCGTLSRAFLLPEAILIWPTILVWPTIPVWPGILRPSLLVTVAGKGASASGALYFYLTQYHGRGQQLLLLGHRVGGPDHVVVNCIELAYLIGTLSTARQRRYDGVEFACIPRPIMPSGDNAIALGGWAARKRWYSRRPFSDVRETAATLSTAANPDAPWASRPALPAPRFDRCF
jgi:hypothetical protein